MTTTPNRHPLIDRLSATPAGQKALVNAIRVSSSEIRNVNMNTPAGALQVVDSPGSLLQKVGDRMRQRRDAIQNVRAALGVDDIAAEGAFADLVEELMGLDESTKGSFVRRAQVGAGDLYLG